MESVHSFVTFSSGWTPQVRPGLSVTPASQVQMHLCSMTSIKARIMKTQKGNPINCNHNLNKLIDTAISTFIIIASIIMKSGRICNGGGKSKTLQWHSSSGENQSCLSKADERRFKRNRKTRKKDSNIVKLGHVTPNCAGCIKTVLERGRINFTKSCQNQSAGRDTEMLVSEEE